MDHIIIEGFMGSGKGSVGKKLAAMLGVPLVDTDKMIMDRMKASPAEIYDRFGDIYYRALETYMLGKLAQKKERCVIIVGSGLPLMPQNKDYLQDLGRVYYLQADAASIAARLEKNKKKDWLDENDDLKERVKSLLKEREPGYLSAADVIVAVAKRTVADVVDEIIADVNREDSGAGAADAPAAAEEAEVTADMKESVQAPAAEKKPAEEKPKKTAAKKKTAARSKKKAEPQDEAPAVSEAAAAASEAEAKEAPAQEEAPKPKKKVAPKRKPAAKKKADSEAAEEPEVKQAESEAAAEPEKKKAAPKKKPVAKKTAAKKAKEETPEE